MARMSIPNTTEPAKQKPFSAAQIEHALIELGVEYTRGPKEAVTHCIFHNDTGKPNLYVNLQMKPGVYHCLSGDTRYVTDSGTRTLLETVGTTQSVLTSAGGFSQAEIRSFGKQELYEVRLERFGMKKSLWATSKHRWFAKHNGRAYETTTDALVVGDYLLAVVGQGIKNVVQPSPCWRVASVGSDVRIDEVFCAIVPSTSNFVLEDNILTGNCFACEVRGSFDEFVRVKTGWTLVKTLQFLIDLRKTISFVEDASKRVAITPQESELDRYAFRHPYCYERGLLEDTLQRWHVGYDKADEALTLPWFDMYGKLVTIKRRSVLTKRYTYPANVDLRGVLFGMQFIKLNSYVWITEGEFDAMYIDQCFRTAHFDNHFAVALGGKTLHDAAFDAICKRQPKEIVLLLDMDSHGRGAVQTIARKIIEYVTVAVPTYSTKDPNELSYAEVVSLTRQIEKD